MNILKTTALAAICALGVSSANAATYLGYFGGNDSLKDGLVIPELKIDSPGLYKCDRPEGSLSCKSTITSVGGDFKIGFTSSKSGSWTWGGAGLTPHYMVVKAGPGYAVYDVLADGGSGFWDTSGVDKKDLSHISFYNTGGLSEVPLPASALLLLAGLGGLGVMRRRK